MIISFPNMGDYATPIENMLKRFFPKAKILKPFAITQRTIEYGAKHSPDFVCCPFKYDLGNYIESLEKGADVLIQAGGGCRFGFYGELQEQILRDLGYKFTFIRIFDGSLNLFSLKKAVKKLGGKASLISIGKTILLTAKIVRLMDGLDFYMRKNIGFEAICGTFESLKAEFLNRIKNVKGFKNLRKIKKEFWKKYKSVEIKKPDNCLKVGLVGELYSLMEPFSNYFMEKELAKNGISVSRFINATYLMLEKRKSEKKTVKSASPYIKYHLGADGTDSVAKAKLLANKNFDGIIHIKPFGCTPEVNAMPMLININKDYGIPVLYFSFDSQTSQTGVITRLEAFYDMLKIRKSISKYNNI